MMWKGGLRMQGNETRDVAPLDSATYRLLVERSNDGIAVIQDGVIRYVNARIEELLGHPADEVIDAALVEYVHPDDRALVSERYEMRMAGEAAPIIYEIRVRTATGEHIPVEINAGITSFEARPADVILVRDVRSRRRTEDTLRDVNRKVEQLHQAAYRLADAKAADDVYRETVRSAEVILAFTKCTLDILEGDRLVVKATSGGIVPGESQDAPLEQGGLAAETLRTKETYVFGSLAEVPVARPTHSDFQSGISVPIGDFGVFQAASKERDAFSHEDARLLGLLVRHAAEALERIRLHSELEEQATRDPLTGVFNRRHFTERIGEELERSRRYEHPLAFLMLDINGFKTVNDTYGHQTGDLVLQGVARGIEDELRSVDIVIRYGGDEFLVVLPETNGEADIIAERLQKAIEERSKDESFSPVPVSLAIGVAYWAPDGAESLDDVLRIADARMYEAKRQWAEKT